MKQLLSLNGIYGLIMDNCHTLVCFHNFCEESLSIRGPACQSCCVWGRRRICLLFGFDKQMPPSFHKIYYTDDVLCIINGREMDKRMSKKKDKISFAKDANRNEHAADRGIVSACQLPEVKDAAASYSIVNPIDHQDNWIMGRMDDTHLSLNYFLQMEKGNYRVSINDPSYRMIVSQYDNGYKFLKATDLCNGDILNVGTLAEYLTIAIYIFQNRVKLEHGIWDIREKLSKGLEVTLTRIANLEDIRPDKEKLTSEVNAESLSNYYNFRDGWYKSWGGAYEKLDGNMCTRNLYQVDEKPYRININDSRISLSISEFDASGKWIKFNGALLNGDSFTKQPQTAYIGLMIKSRKWGADLLRMFEDGLRIDLATDQYIPKTGTIDMKDAQLAKTDHWKMGAYLYETGEYIIDHSKLRYDSFLRVDDKDYVVRLPGGYLKMNLLELNQNGIAIANNDLQSGQRWRKSQNTEKIAITISDVNKTFTTEEYKKLISEYPNFGLEEYVRYSHNTVMKDITAAAFVNNINVGWNLGNSLDSQGKENNKAVNLNQETFWGNPYVTKDLIDYVKGCGFNTIRIPVTWYYNTDRDGNGRLRINQDWLNRVQDVVDYAIANQMYVLLNSHQDQPLIYAGAEEDDFQQVLKNARELWTDIADHFKSYDEHLVFEAYNEVDNIEKYWNYGDKAALQMNELNQVFVDAVRASGGNNSKRLLVIPTLLDRMDSRFYAAFQMPVDTVAKKIAVTVHTYNLKFHQDIESEFEELEDFSRKVNAPVIIGEFGTQYTFPIPELRAKHASNFVARAAAHGIKCIWWDNGSDYKVIDRRDYAASDQGMISALLEGARGIGYQVDKVKVFKEADQFVYLTPNINTGELKYTYWGTLTTDVSGEGMAVESGPICTVSLKAKNEAAGVWLQRLLYYNEQGGLVQPGKEIQSKFFIGTVPQGAATARVSMNSPNIDIKLEDYHKYLRDGDLELIVGFFHSNDVKKVQLTVKAFGYQPT